jgi:protein-tyrosine phosphatase
MASILVVCTGNICRSPIAEGMLRSALVARLGDAAPSVSSVGTMGWAGSPADPSSVEAAAERGVDISGHRGRELRPEDALGSDLVLAMAREHAEAMRNLVPKRSFTLKELVRLLEALPTPGDGDPEALLATRVAEADALRRSGFEGNPYDEDVMDPLGMPLESFRAIAWELEDLCGRLADGLFGRAPVPMHSGAEEEE